MSRKKTTRHKAIIDQLSVNPSMRVSELSDALGVTTETIRRDLEELAAQQLINRTYGGALLRQPAEPVLSERHKANVAERAMIGKAAAPLLKGARILMMGSGATTVQVAKRIAFEMNNITVVTHSFGVATALSLNPTIEVVLAPGVYHAGEGAVHGAQTLRFLSDYSVDWAILGASGISPAGPTDALMDAAEVYACMLRQSSRHMIVADHSKFDRMATARFSQWQDIDVLVTDIAPQGPLGQALASGGVDIQLAG
tara:strand:- start:6804 stop:7568 length:765 start_codon:yes stop_codon:yes gene_type:complete